MFDYYLELVTPSNGFCSTTWYEVDDRDHIRGIFGTDHGSGSRTYVLFLIIGIIYSS